MRKRNRSLASSQQRSRLRPSLLISILALTTTTVPFVKGQMDECKGVALDIVEEHAFSIDSCLKSYNATSIKSISPSDIACVGKCVVLQTGMIDEEGHPHKENIWKTVRDWLPQEVHDHLQVKFEACLAEETADLDPKDESCISYLPLMMCLHLAFLEECM